MMTLDYIINVAVELALKNSYRTYPYSYVMVMMILDYIINVTVELASKNVTNGLKVSEKVAEVKRSTVEYCRMV